MQTELIVALLIAERDRLSRAIEALQGPLRRRGRPPKVGGDKTAAVAASTQHALRRRRISAAGRKAMAQAARRRWAAIKAGKLSSPIAKRQRTHRS